MIAVSAAELLETQSQLHTSQRQTVQLAQENDALTKLLLDYENTLANLMDKLRNYAYEHTRAIVATHKHYNGLVEKEREANLQLRIEHGQWQQGLGRATELARKALRERTEETSGLETGLKEVKAENRILRRLVGWKVEDDSDEDEIPQQREAVRRKQGIEAHAGAGQQVANTQAPAF